MASMRHGPTNPERTHFRQLASIEAKAAAKEGRRARLSSAVWSAVSRDRKLEATVDTDPAILTLDPNTGGTVLVPVDIF